MPVAGVSTAVAVAAGAGHTCIILRSGPVQCWGDNTYGQLGSGTTIKYSGTPVKVLAIHAPIELVAGTYDTCALFSGGTVRCWGDDRYGQCGDLPKDINRPRRSPVTVVGTPGVVWAKQ